MLETNRLILRKWTEADADSLFEYAKDPQVGPIAGWPPHKSKEDSLFVIRNVLNGAECYAICEKDNIGKVIGSIELMLNGHTKMTDHDDECELGYWLGVPFWGKGYIPEAAREIIRHGFEDIGMSSIWCGYYEGNQKSKRVQEKVGFTFHHKCEDVAVPLMNEARNEYTNLLTKEHWNELRRDYRAEATKCVNNYVLPEMKRQFEECNCSLDEQYKKYGNTEYFFANIIKPGHVYEIGYPRCVCNKTQEVKDADPNFCECSRQSILYVYENLIPDKNVTVEILETALRDGGKCRFRVTVE